MSRQIYKVKVTREGGSWLADVPALDGVHTWARSLPKLNQAIREAIALAEDLPDNAEAGLHLEFEYAIGDPELEAATTQLRADRERVQREERELAARTAEAARRLVTQHAMSVRDAATLLNVSMQRVSQVAPQASDRATDPGAQASASTGKKARASSTGKDARSSSSAKSARSSKRSATADRGVA